MNDTKNLEKKLETSKVVDEIYKEFLALLEKYNHELVVSVELEKFQVGQEMMYRPVVRFSFVPKSEKNE